MDFEAELAAVRNLSVREIADAIVEIGFECTRCGRCCQGNELAHTATVFPDEIRRLANQTRQEWQTIARPMPYGLNDGTEPTGETFEWALQTAECGDCTFYDDGGCSVYADRPLICQTYPFSIADIADRHHDERGALRTTEQMGEGVQQEEMVRAHECEGLGREISREDAEELAVALKERAIRELAEAIDVTNSYEPTDVEGIVVHDSEGQKRPDGCPIE